MATKTDTTRLEIQTREAQHSRANRRLRRAGQVPGVIYGRGDEPQSFSVDALQLRRAMASTGAVFELALGDDTTPVVIKDTQRHPVRGEVMHVDFVRVDLNTAILATVTIHVAGGDEAPGVIDGGVLTQETNEIEVQALPSDVPDTIEFDASGLGSAETVYVSALKLPDGVTLSDAAAEIADETVLVSITAPANLEAAEGIESETEVVGEGEASATSDDTDAGDDATDESSGGDE